MLSESEAKTVSRNKLRIMLREKRDERKM